jgi:thiamine-phosphate pyrophosphorylase
MVFGLMKRETEKGRALLATLCAEATLCFHVETARFDCSSNSLSVRAAPMNTIANARLYAILDLGYAAMADAERVAESLCSGGVDILQLRAKNFPEEEIEALGTRIEPITRSAGVPLIINDFPELVPAIGAQGAHVGQEDRPIADARWRAGRALAGEADPPIIGKSTHSVAQAVAAAQEGADYIGFGPLFATATKPGRPAIGLDDVRAVHEAVRLPIFCIGGIKLENLDAVVAAGARRVVIVSALLCAPDIAAACRAVKSRLP